MKSPVIALLALVGNTLLFWLVAMIFIGSPDILLCSIYAAPFALLGWLVGWMVNGLLVYPRHRTRNYIKGQIGLTIAGILFVAWVTSGNGRPRNAERNEALLEQPVNGEDTTRPDLSLRSFKTLEQTFPDPNDLRLQQHFSIGPLQGVYPFYFVYTVAGDSRYWYARVDAYPDSSVVVVRQRDVYSDHAFVALQRAAAVAERDRMDSLVRLLRRVPDSDLEKTGLKQLLDKYPKGR